jgi:hypothetical protein
MVDLALNELEEVLPGHRPYPRVPTKMTTTYSTVILPYLNLAQHRSSWNANSCLLCTTCSSAQDHHGCSHGRSLSAIARHIDRPPIMGEYVAGMWEPWLHSSLLWWSDHRSTRKPAPGTATHVRPDQSSIPTWSWLAVEGLISTWGRNPDSLLKIVSINHQSSINDVYAESRNTSLVLESRIVPIQLTAEPEAPVLKRYRIKTASTSRFGLLIPDTNPLEIEFNMLPTTTFIAIEYSVCEPPLLNCLILTRDSKDMNAFRRLGIAELDESFFIGTVIQKCELF